MPQSPTAANRAITAEEYEQLQEDVDILIRAIPDDIWHELQHITLADLIEDPASFLPFCSYLSNHQKIKLALPKRTSKNITALSNLSTALNSTKEYRDCRYRTFRLLNQVVGRKHKS